jgi:hypothetical protein
MTSFPPVVRCALPDASRCQDDRWAEAAHPGRARDSLRTASSVADGDGFGDTPTMTFLPPATPYHRWMGWHASSMRRAVIVACIGLLVALMLVWFVSWELAVIAGWDAAAFALLLGVGPIILRANSSHAAQLATREDESRGSATLLLVASSVMSLLGVGFVLNLAGQDSGPPRVLLIGVRTAAHQRTSGVA